MNLRSITDTCHVKTDMAQGVLKTWTSDPCWGGAEATNAPHDGGRLVHLCLLQPGGLMSTPWTSVALFCEDDDDDDV